MVRFGKVVILLFLAVCFVCTATDINAASPSKKRISASERFSKRKSSGDMYHQRKEEGDMYKIDKRPSSADIYKAKKTKPEILVKLDLDKTIDYRIIEGDTIPCSSLKAVGCAPSVSYIDYDYDISDGILKKFTVTIGFKSIEIRIASKYPKGTCEFDLILKHELTHIELRRAVYKKYAVEMAKALIVKADTLNPLLDIAELRTLTGLADTFFSDMKDEAGKQDALLDESGNNVYRWDQCRNPPSENANEIQQ